MDHFPASRAPSSHAMLNIYTVHLLGFPFSTLIKLYHVYEHSDTRNSPASRTRAHPIHFPLSLRSRSEGRSASSSYYLSISTSNVSQIKENERETERDLRKGREGRGKDSENGWEAAESDGNGQRKGVGKLTHRREKWWKELSVRDCCA
ncbi:hypothetical protein E2C01_085889 [Portunus trituberculatus]|uniref:Uncharacterized protein n=1 Tax=Portunus trituberculatus TaxID=210409 RepID=A0A5B7J880_PORTR|nr:hypothetical protein [Portunus trituberculatus]